MTRKNILIKTIKKSSFIMGARLRAHTAYRRYIRPLMPQTRTALYSGISVPHTQYLGDRFVRHLLGSFDTDDVPTYEHTLIAGLRTHIRAGDKVVVVGGGKGVTCVAAARAAGENGRVTAFEGGAAQVDMAQRTIALNRLSHLIDVHHAIVGPAISVYDSSADVKRIAASELPACDVLELDCEGAEVDILQNMTITPRVILVETHGMYGSTSPLCTALLEAKGYRVTPLGLAEPRVADYCEQNDIRILAGERSPMQEPAKAAKDLSPERRPEA